MTNYIVATLKSWNADTFHKYSRSLPGQWHLVTEKDELTSQFVEELSPRYIFFPHWSYKVQPEIFENFECVCFHMTDVPYGRGGSPLQNLIVRGHKETKLTALRMVEEMDAGPVYMKKPLSLEGAAEDILRRASAMSYEMIKEIVQKEPQPVPQKGEIVTFKRRKPEESDISSLDDSEKIYDYIRMLDAEGYPHAFIETEHFRIEFEDAILDGKDIQAKATIRLKS